jgi:hypothetical protein
MGMGQSSSFTVVEVPEALVAPTVVEVPEALAEGLDLY